MLESQLSSLVLRSAWYSIPLSPKKAQRNAAPPAVPAAGAGVGGPAARRARQSPGDDSLRSGRCCALPPPARQRKVTVFVSGGRNSRVSDFIGEVGRQGGRPVRRSAPFPARLVARCCGKRCLTCRAGKRSPA